MRATSSGRATYRTGATPGGPITGKQVVPCPWQKEDSAGPMNVAGDSSGGESLGGEPEPAAGVRRQIPDQHRGARGEGVETRALAEVS